jgi:peptidoglycan/xylan/chitin deacetylase (PgdA/CDA1 family)
MSHQPSSPPLSSPPAGVMFHHFHGVGHPPSQGSISAGQLRLLVDFVGRDRILPAREWIERATNDALRPGDVCLTFDDNLRCQFDVAVPVLRELGLTACFFVHSSVLTGSVERLELDRRFRSTRFNSVDDFYVAFYAEVDAGPFAARVRQAMLRFDARTYLSGYAFYTADDRRFRFVRDDVLGPEAYRHVMDRMLADRGIDERELAEGTWMNADHLLGLHREGHVLGLHSHTHPTRFARLSPQQQRDEYTINWRILKQITGSPPTAMAHPSNSYSPYTLSILRQLGVRVGFRANTSLSGPYCCYEHPREDHANLVRAMLACTATRQAA